MKRISEKVYRECETLDDLIKKMGRTKDGYVVSDVGDVNTFKSRLESFKEVIKEKLPEFTIREILKFDEYFYELKSLYEWYGVDRLFAALEFEERTKNEKKMKNKITMGWNHRILAHEHNGEVYLQIHEVHYDNGIPNAYSEKPISVGGEDLKTITWTLNKMLECRKKPILWAGDRFPNEYKIKYICELCGRNNFDTPSPHKCKGGFRKRGLRWKTKTI